MREGGWTAGLAVAVFLAAASLGDAALPRLPADRPLPRGPDSPGVVVFSHSSHVAEAKPSCTTCHPRLFRIQQKYARVTHAQMEAGRQCGACHDGKAATGLTDCAACHRDQ
jgi:c(7)-type cytochrome triheme protein